MKDDFGHEPKDTGKTPGCSPTPGVGLGTLPLPEIQRSGALRGSIPGVSEVVSRVLRGAPGGP